MLAFLQELYFSHILLYNTARFFRSLTPSSFILMMLRTHQRPAKSDQGEHEKKNQFMVTKFGKNLQVKKISEKGMFFLTFPPLKKRYYSAAARMPHFLKKKKKPFKRYFKVSFFNFNCIQLGPKKKRGHAWLTLFFF